MTKSVPATGPLRLVSKWTVLPGHESAALAAITALAAAVKAREPGTLMYLVHTPFDERVLQSLPPPNGREVLFFEMYASAQAFEDHVNGPLFTEFVARHGALFLQSNGKPYVLCEFLQPVAGFVRHVV